MVIWFITTRKVKGKKGKALPAHSMKAHMGSGGIAPPILNLGNIPRRVFNFTLCHRERNPVSTE
jgi:hypothetical protein